MKPRKVIRIILFAIGFFAIGYLRESIFVNIAYSEWALQDVDNHFEIPEYLNFLKSQTAEGLFLLRWAFTLTFILVNFALTYWFVRLTYNRKFQKWVILCFLIIFLISALFYGLYYLNPNFETSYTIARQLAGMIQSPFALIVIIPLIELNKKLQST